jgi:hypothetical protein
LLRGGVRLGFSAIVALKILVVAKAVLTPITDRNIAVIKVNALFQ